MKRNMEYEFSIGLRWTHWIRFVAIIILTVTGFYIAYVFVAPEVSNEPILFLQAKLRMWHSIAGFALIAATIFKTYLFFFDRKSRNERISLFDFLSPKVWIQQIKHYLFMGDHPHIKGVYNPLQFMAYIGLYMLVLAICVTGLVLYVHTYQADGLGAFLYPYMRPLEAMMGGLAMVREIHHIVMWGLLIFTPVHIYMAVFNSVKGKEGALDAVFSGYKYFKPHNKH